MLSRAHTVWEGGPRERNAYPSRPTCKMASGDHGPPTALTPQLWLVLCCVNSTRTEKKARPVSYFTKEVGPCFATWKCCGRHVGERTPCSASFSIQVPLSLILLRGGFSASLHCRLGPDGSRRWDVLGPTGCKAGSPASTPQMPGASPPQTSPNVPWGQSPCLRNTVFKSYHLLLFRSY